MVETAAKPFGLNVRVCSGGDQPVTGRFNFRDAHSVAGLLTEKGFPVAFDGQSLSVGCDQAAYEAPTMGFSAPSSQPGGFSPGQPVPQVVPSEPPTFERVTARYADPSKLAATLSKLPGLSVIADPDIPGPMLLAGPASIVKEARRFMEALDRCPAQLEVQALVVASGEETERSRAMGIQFRASSDAVLGTFDPTAGSQITIPGLRAYLDASRSSGSVRQNSTFASRALVGETVELVDGQELPVRAATSVTDRETRADVVYRSIGHKLTLKVEALDAEAVVTVHHELSSLGAQTALGPSFSTRSTATTMRVALDEPVVVSLAGTDLASKDRSRGIFSRSDATSVRRGGLYLVFAMRRLGCGPRVAGDFAPINAPSPAELLGQVEPPKKKGKRK